MGKYERAVAKVNGKICCAAGHVGFDIGTYHNSDQTFLFSLLEYEREEGSEERPKNEDVEARKLGASNLLPFAVQTTNHYPTAGRSLVAHWPVLQSPPDSVFVCYVDVRITTE